MRERIAAEGDTGRWLEFNPAGMGRDPKFKICHSPFLRPPHVSAVRPQFAEPLGTRIPTQAEDEAGVTVVPDPADHLAASVRRVDIGRRQVPNRS